MKSEITDANFQSSIFISLHCCNPHVVQSIHRPARTFKPLTVDMNNIDHLATEQYSAGTSELQTKHPTPTDQWMPSGRVVAYFV